MYRMSLSRREQLLVSDGSGKHCHSLTSRQGQDGPLHYAELNILYVCLDDWSSKGDAGLLSRPSSASTTVTCCCGPSAVGDGCVPHVLNLVESSYWHQMEAGNLRPGSDEAEVLLTSIRVAQSPVLPDLWDLKALSSGLVEGDIQWWKVVPRPCLPSLC